MWRDRRSDGWRLPAVEAGPHLGYVGQWILIGIASISVYVTVLRSFRREERHTAN